MSDASTALMTVVIPVRNAATTLVDQLASLASADPPPGGFEVVVADNGSTDGTRHAARSFEDRLTVHILDASGSAGASYARNLGVRESTAERVLFCDADDEIDSGWLVAMWQAFEDGHELVAGPIDYRRLNPAPVRAWRGADRATAAVVLGFLPSGHSANLGVTRQLHEAVGGFDEDFVFGGEDVDFCWRAQIAGYALHTDSGAVVHYRLRPSLRALFTQSRAYGAAEAHLFAKFRDLGLNRRPVLTVGRDVWWLLSRMPFALPVGRRGAWLRRLGQQVGRLEGSARYRAVWW